MLPMLIRFHGVVAAVAVTGDPLSVGSGGGASLCSGSRCATASCSCPT